VPTIPPAARSPAGALIRGETKDERHREQRSREWRARSNSTALRDAYQEVVAFHQPGSPAELQQEAVSLLKALS
jgi:hypothetical protein